MVQLQLVLIWAFATLCLGGNLGLSYFDASPLACAHWARQQWMVHRLNQQSVGSPAHVIDALRRTALRLRGGNPTSTSAMETKGVAKQSHDQEKDQPNVLLGLTGSVASIKAMELVQGLARFANVRVVTTEKGEHFFDKDLIERELKIEIFTDEDEWALWNGRGDPVQHIDLRRWADVLVVAPLSANTMAKLAMGMCDNLLTCTVRAWSFEDKPLLVAPAMNTAMWNQPCTRQHLSILKAWGVAVIPPVRKVLVCGEDGVGAMAAVDDICCDVQRACSRQKRSNIRDAKGWPRCVRFLSRLRKEAVSCSLPFILGILITKMGRSRNHKRVAMDSIG